MQKTNTENAAKQHIAINSTCHLKARLGQQKKAEIKWQQFLSILLCIRCDNQDIKTYRTSSPEVDAKPIRAVTKKLEWTNVNYIHIKQQNHFTYRIIHLHTVSTFYKTKIINPRMPQTTKKQKLVCTTETEDDYHTIKSSNHQHHISAAAVQ